MNFRFLQGESAWVQLLVFMGMVAIGAIVATGAVMVLISAVYGFSPLALAGDYSSLSQAEIMALKWLQIFSTIGLFVLPAFGFAAVASDQPIKSLGLRKGAIGWLALAIVPLLILSAGPIINLTAAANEAMQLPEALTGLENWMKDSEANAKVLTETFLKMDGIGALIFNLFLIGILPAIAEELGFRGILLPLFTRMANNAHAGIWITAIIFSAIHMQFYGFIPRMLLGALMGYLYYWSGSLWLPILAHAVNNGMAVIGHYAIQRKWIDESLLEVGGHDIGEMLYAVLPAVLIFSALMRWLYLRLHVNPD